MPLKYLIIIIFSFLSGCVTYQKNEIASRKNEAIRKCILPEYKVLEQSPFSESLTNERITLYRERKYKALLEKNNVFSCNENDTPVDIIMTYKSLNFRSVPRLLWLTGTILTVGIIPYKDSYLGEVTVFDKKTGIEIGKDQIEFDYWWSDLLYVWETLTLNFKPDLKEKLSIEKAAEIITNSNIAEKK